MLKKIMAMLLCTMLAAAGQAAELANSLKNHASPYLAMHGDDPVAWQQWGQDVFQRARREGKLVYVSSGYFSCHWCHVMQRESYRDKQVAKILNTYFIPVKVDREINTALDSKLIDFVERTQGHAGWPLNVFVTPQGYPLVGMTYVPRDNFVSILNNIRQRWNKERASLQKMARDVSIELEQVTTSVDRQGLSAKQAASYLQGFMQQADVMFDDMSGGFGEQNKFPSVPQLQALLYAWQQTADKRVHDFLLLTLDKMATQGLFDHLGGGFFRYATDPGWQIPHFEKMLYDNALLASLYLQAAKVLKKPAYETVARKTLDFMLAQLRHREGAFQASLSAIDNKGVEGGYYLWQRSQLESVLSAEELKLMELIWQLEGPPDLEHGHHLVEVMNVTEAATFLKIPQKKAARLFASARKKMLHERSKRQLPVDSKLLAGWNGLALSALVQAAMQLQEPRYAAAAEKLKQYLYQHLWKNGELLRAVKHGRVVARAQLEDYAFVAKGVQDWLRFRNNHQDQVWLNSLVQQAWQRFYSEKGWRMAEDMLLKYRQHEAVLADSVLPSASAVLIDVSLQLPLSPLQKQAGLALRRGLAALSEEPFWYATQIRVMQQAVR